MFPLLKKQSIYYALGFLIFRILEVIMFSFTEINSLAIVTLSKEFATLEVINVSYIELLAKQIQENRSWTYGFGLQFFSIGATLFYISMYKSKIIPRFISSWGIVAGILAFTMSLINMFDLNLPSILGIFFYIPIALN